MSVPLDRPITYDELCRLPDDGRLYEIYDGIAVVNAAPFWPHQDVVGKLHIAFHNAIRDRSKIFVAPLDVVFTQTNVMQPDLVLVLERNLGILQNAVRGVPDLVVEVLSPSTSARDREVKKRVYARFGVPEYWMADLRHRTVEVHRLAPGGDAYGPSEVFRPGQRATTPLVPALAVDVTALFGD